MSTTETEPENDEPTWPDPQDDPDEEPTEPWARDSDPEEEL